MHLRRVVEVSPPLLKRIEALEKRSADGRAHRFDFAEYVELEAASSTKHEFLDGRVFAMAGGSPEHGGDCERCEADRERARGIALPCVQPGFPSSR